MNQARLAKNALPPPRTANGAVREGSALLQGLATCGRCGRHLRVYYQGKNSTPGYYCEQQDQAALQQFRLQVERARYEAERAERRYRAVEPENRLVAFAPSKQSGSTNSTINEAPKPNWRAKRRNTNSN